MACEVAMARKGAIVVVTGDIFFVCFAIARVIDQRSLYLTKHHFDCLPFEYEPTAGFSPYCGPITRPHHRQVNVVTSPKPEHAAHRQDDKHDGCQPKASAPT